MLNLSDIESLSIEPEETIDCEHCKTVCRKDERLCRQCGYPMYSSEEEYRAFRIQCIEEEYEMSVTGRIFLSYTSLSLR